MGAPHHPAERRQAAINDYHTSGESLLTVSKRHGVSKAALSAWIRPGHKRRVRKTPWTEAELAYVGGWEVIGGIKRPLFPEQRSA